MRNVPMTGWLLLAVAVGCSRTAPSDVCQSNDAGGYVPLPKAVLAAAVVPQEAPRIPAARINDAQVGAPAPATPRPADRRLTVIPVDFADEPLPKAAPATRTVRRLELPPGLPGAWAAPLQLPPFDPNNPAPRQEAIKRMFPDLPPLQVAEPVFAPGVKPLSLPDLEQIARDHNPLIRQAMADIRSARGAAVQAGLYPNPTVGYEADNINTGRTAGYQGGFIEQLIKTGGKLDLARAAAMVGVSNAEVALRRTQINVAHDVRAGYFAVLVAQENVRVSDALARLTDEAYRIQVDMTRGGEAAVYEPMQLRVLAYQARTTLLQARNRYTAAWKQLAATMGVPGMPPNPLSGGVDMPVPVVRHDLALARVLSANPDVQTAANTLEQARINVRLAYANRIPDITAHVALQKDNTTAPFEMTENVIVSIPVPIFDRNQGNIDQVEGQLANASEGPHQTRDDLTNRLADAFERYDDNRRIIDYYRQRILPDQVQAFRGTYDRHQLEPDVVGFADVVAAEQTLSGVITSYTASLGTMWTAVVDMGALLGADDLLRMGEPQPNAPIPDLNQLCPLPCCHCSPLWTMPGVQTGDPRWPEPEAPSPAATDPQASAWQRRRDMLPQPLMTAAPQPAVR